MLVMGVLFEYFSAISNDVAASVIDRPGGPASSTGAPSETPPHVAFDVVATKGIDPVVQLGNLEALLTERPFDDVRASPRSGALVDIRDDGELLVLAVTDELTAALAAADVRYFDHRSRMPRAFEIGEPPLRATDLARMADHET